MRNLLNITKRLIVSLIPAPKTEAFTSESDKVLCATVKPIEGTVMAKAIYTKEDLSKVASNQKPRTPTAYI